MQRFNLKISALFYTLICLFLTHPPEEMKQGVQIGAGGCSGWSGWIISKIFNYFLISCYGLVQISTGSRKAYSSKKRTGQYVLRSVSHVRYPIPHSGWRIYMEDAHISNSPISNSKNSLFGVFDGHGGTLLFTQAPKWPLLSSVTSSKNSRPTKTTNSTNTRRLFARPS